MYPQVLSSVEGALPPAGGDDSSGAPDVLELMRALCRRVKDLP